MLEAGSLSHPRLLLVAEMPPVAHRPAEDLRRHITFTSSPGIRHGPKADDIAQTPKRYPDPLRHADRVRNPDQDPADIVVIGAPRGHFEVLILSYGIFIGAECARNFMGSGPFMRVS
jgi:hypothetical protein